jgi:hypothetical protein
MEDPDLNKNLFGFMNGEGDEENEEVNRSPPKKNKKIEQGSREADAGGEEFGQTRPTDERGKRCAQGGLQGLPCS